VKFAGEDKELDCSETESLVREIFGSHSQQDIDYVVKNMHRLDTDGSGSVDFPEFVNIIYKTGQLLV